MKNYLVNKNILSEAYIAFTYYLSETAKLLKQLGDPIQKITQVTGLSELEVEAL